MITNMLSLGNHQFTEKALATRESTSKELVN